MFRKKQQYDKLTYQELFSNDILAHSLDNLNWTDASNETDEWQYIKLKDLEDESIFFATLLSVLPRKRFGKYIYTKVSNRIERQDTSKIKKEKEHKKFTISKPFKVDVNLDDTKQTLVRVS